MDTVVDSKTAVGTLQNATLVPPAVDVVKPDDPRACTKEGSWERDGTTCRVGRWGGRAEEGGREGGGERGRG